MIEANVFAAGMTDNHEYPAQKDPNAFVPLDPALFGYERIKHAACGYRTSFFLTDSDQLYCCGQNSSGELGTGSLIDYEPLVKNKTVIPHYGTIETILGGDTFTFFIMKDGTFWRCGSNSDGQIGAGSRTKLSTPEPLDPIPWGAHRVTKIAFGYYHSAILVNSTLYISGKLSGSDTTYSYTKISENIENMIGKIADVACGVFNTMVVNRRGHLYCIGQSIESAVTSEWTKMNIDSPISKIFCGSLSGIAISAQDEVYCWGDNGSGETGFPSSRVSNWTMHHDLSYKGITTVGIHTYQTIIITRSGQCFICGNNSNNQLGVTMDTGKGPKRSTQLEELIRKFSNKTAFITGGFQHMMIYFADGAMSRGKTYMIAMLRLASKSSELSDMTFEFENNSL